MSNNLRPFLAKAAGFIFGSGENLSHIANIIRYCHIPACISAELWSAAIGLDGIYAEFRSGNESFCPEEERKRYATAYESYCRQLETAVLQIPVYDMEAKALQPPGRQAEYKIGRKALSVNTLASLGHEAPKAMILGNFVSGVSTIDGDCIEAVLGFMNPSGSGKRAMIFRPSLYTDLLSKRFASGLIPSRTATDRDGIIWALESILEEWNRLCKVEEYHPISVIIQEYVSAMAHGVLFTRVPWDYASDRIVIRLTFHNAEGDWEEQFTIDPPSGQAQRFHGYLPEMLPPAVSSAVANSKFLSGLERFSEECLLLQNRLGIPLDIEFVISHDCEFMPVQFRQAFIGI